MIDLLAGRITAYYSTPSEASPHLETGKLRALAVTSLTRLPSMLNVPDEKVLAMLTRLTG